MRKNQLIRETITVVVLAAITGALYFIDLRYSDVQLKNWFDSFATFTVIYALYHVLEELVTKHIRDSRARYSVRKVLLFSSIIIALMIIIRIWSPDPQSLLVAYGLVGAGVAVSLQDIFKNLAGGIFIFVNGLYKVGDRIEVETRYGDVMDVGLMNTTMLEIRNWVDGDQATGRLTIIPNGWVLSKGVNNYTKDHNFMWDEIMLPITYDSNWKKAVKIIEEIVLDITKETTEDAERQIAHIRERYYLSKRNVEPNVYSTPTDNWIELNIRYITTVRERRLTENKISEKIIEAIQSDPEIQFASATFEVVGVPELVIRD